MKLASTFLLLACLGTPAAAQDGKELFDNSCAACHQAGGVGNPGIAPPLNDPALWQRLGDKAPGYIAGVMISGLTGTIEAAGQMFIGLAMPSHEAMSDEELTAIGTYVLSTVNSTGLTVDTATLDAIRQSPPSHSDLRKLRKG